MDEQTYEFDAEYNDWLDSLQAAAQAEIDQEQYEYETQEVAAMLAGGLI